MQWVEESCDVIGMEFPKGKWVCYSRILGDGIFGTVFSSSDNHRCKT